MKKISKWIVKKFLNYYWKKRPPESVKYYKKKEYERARLFNTKDGVKMQIEGEKYAFPGHPRGHVLFGSLAKLKHNLKHKVFHAIFEEATKCWPDMLPDEKLCPFVRELSRVFDELENAEITPDMKARAKNLKKALCFFLQEDDAYRFRAQWILERLDIKKCKLSKADKYFFRAKWFKPDTDKFDY